MHQGSQDSVGKFSHSFICTYSSELANRYSHQKLHWQDRMEFSRDTVREPEIVIKSDLPGLISHHLRKIITRAVCMSRYNTTTSVLQTPLLQLSLRFCSSRRLMAFLIPAPDVQAYLDATLHRHTGMQCLLPASAFSIEVLPEHSAARPWQECHTILDRFIAINELAPFLIFRP